MSELRQRNVGFQIDDNEVKRPNRVRSSILKADMFNKPKEDYTRHQTFLGSAVSSATLVVLTLLILYNVLDYAIGGSAYRTELSIEGNNTGYMSVSIDIDFLRTPCHKLRVDLADSAGTLRRNITHHLHKIPIRSDGEVAFSANDFYEIFSDDVMYNSTMDPESSFCGKCIAEGDEKYFAEKQLNISCCNTCDEVRSFYKVHNVETPKEGRTQQCLYEISLRNPGCKVSGTLRLKRVRGALVFGPKGNLANGLQYSFGDFFEFIATHKINSLYFGSKDVFRYPRSGPPVLNGHLHKSKSIEEVKYMLSAVPTNYRMSSRSRRYEKESFEYSVKTRSTLIHIGMPSIPSVTFYFDISPIKITNIFEREPFAQFLVRLCGVVGGVFVVSGLVDDAFQFLDKRIKK